MTQQLRIGIVGAGVSGMTAAWLLQDDHHVTLFDRAPVLGGHVETIPVEHEGQTIQAEVGPRFFFDTSYPYFLSLLRLLDVPIRWTPGWASFTDIAREHTVVLPPRSPRQLLQLLRSPRLVRHVLAMRRLVEEQSSVAARRDATKTFRQHLTAHGYPASFGPELAYPFLAACWGAPLAELPDFPVYSLLKGMPSGKSPGFYVIPGGMGRYVRAFADELPRVTLRLGAGIRRIDCRGGFRVEDDEGTSHGFDRLIVATSARDAATLLRDAPEAAAMHRAVDGFRHFETEIVIHGDASFMPPDRRDWAHNNLFVDCGNAWMTDWQGILAGAPVFRTWLPAGRALPQPLYGRRKFHHLLMRPENALLQRRVAAAQGAAGLFVTGMYATDVDNHESALLSGVVPALVLAPRSRNLARLTGGVGPGAVHGLEILAAPLVDETPSLRIASPEGAPPEGTPSGGQASPEGEASPVAEAPFEPRTTAVGG